METQTTNTAAQLTANIIAAWNTQALNVTAFFEKYTDADYLKPIAPGRNRPVYILGHLIASNDSLMPLLGFGHRLFPELQDIFITSPDGAVNHIPTLGELKQKWETQHNILNKHFATLEPHHFLERHTAVSEEDFATQPHRNKLNIILGRTNHMGYHLGQLNLFPEKKRLKYNPFRTSVSLNFAF